VNAALEWAAPSDDGHVADGGTVEDVKHGGRDVVLVEDGGCRVV